VRENQLLLQADSSYYFQQSLKLITYTTYYMKTFSNKRRLNGALQRMAQRLEKGFILRKPRELYDVVIGYLESPDIKEYIQRLPAITERYVYELAIKLKEIRKRIYGTT